MLRIKDEREMEKKIQEIIKKLRDKIQNPDSEKMDKQDLAQQIAQEMLAEIEHKTYPIPIVNILRVLGFSVYVNKFKDDNISGIMLIGDELKEKFDSDRIIIIERKDSLGRQRFTLAHELAHFLFDYSSKNKKYASVFKYDIAQDKQDKERIANTFAANFLMPEEMFRNRYEQLKEGNYSEDEIISILASDFQVTITAVARRINEINL